MIDYLFLPNGIVYFSILFVAFFSTYILGRILSGFIPEIRRIDNCYERIFNYLVVGFIFLITFYAVLWTRGNSIFIIAIFLSIIYFISKQYSSDRIYSSVRIKTKEIVSVVLVYGLFVLFFGMAYYLFFIRSGGEIWSDYVFYSNVSHLLTVTHVESTVNIFDSENKVAGIYHFSELWFTSFWSNIFSLSYVYVLHLVTYPYLYSLTILGAIVLGLKFLNNKLAVILLAFSLLFIKPVIFVILPIISKFYIFSELAFFPKLVMIDVLFIFSLIHFIRRNINLAFGSLLLLIPFYSTTIAGVLSGLFILVLYISYKQNGLTIKILWNKYIYILFGVFLFYILFYFIQNWLYQITESSYKISEINSVKANPFFWTVKFSIKRILGSLLALLPVSLICFYYAKKYNDIITQNMQYVLIFIISGVFFSSITSAITSNFVYDGYQISSNFADTTIPIIIFTTILYILSKVKKKIHVTIFVLILFVFYTGVFAYRGVPFTYPKGKSHLSAEEKGFYLELKEEFSGIKTPNPTFAYYRNYDYIDTAKNEFVQTMLFLPMSKIIHFIPNGTYSPYCMSEFDIPKNISKNYNERRGPFWEFVENERKYDSYISMDKCVENFIKDKSIEYIVVEGDANITDYVRNNTKVIASYNGMVLYKLN